MTESYLIGLGRDTLYTGLLIAAPLLGVSLVVGLVISILQATTQIQDQTISFVPKIIAVVVTAVLCAPWIMRVLGTFTQKLLANLPQLAR